MNEHTLTISRVKWPMEKIHWAFNLLRHRFPTARIAETSAKHVIISLMLPLPFRLQDREITINVDWFGVVDNLGQFVYKPCVLIEDEEITDEITQLYNNLKSNL